MVTFALPWVFLLLFDFYGSSLGPLAEAAVVYGPSVDQLVHEALVTQKRTVVNLELFPNGAVLLPLANGSSSGHVSFVHPNGEFTLTAPPDHGIMVVIQSLRFRTSVIYSDAQDTTFLKCRDYLRFHAVNQSSSQVCGHVVKYSKEGNQPGGLLGQRSFITSKREVVVSVHVDTTLADHDYGWHETIMLELAITAFKECPKTSFVTQWMKWTGGINSRSCSPSEDRVCIPTGAFCDDILNCGIRGPLGHIAFDEENCNKQPKPQVSLDLEKTKSIPTTSTTTTSKPLIGVNKPYSPPVSGKVVSPVMLILIFSTIVLLLFGACTWLAKANEKKFQHTMYRFSTMRRQRRNQRQRPGAAGETLTRLPTAPPPSNTTTLGGNADNLVIVGDPDIPGEHPPPYNDLFPTAPPDSNTPTPSH